MDKLNFQKTWKIVISTLLTFMLGVIVSILGSIDSYCTSLTIHCGLFFALMGALAFILILGIVQISWNLIEKNFPKRKIHQFKMPFHIPMTKGQFEERLNKFVNQEDKDPDVLIPPSMMEWRLLVRRRTTDEIKFLIVADEDNRKYADVFNIMEADFIKLIEAPYQGLLIEMISNPNDLQILIHPEGHKVSDTKVQFVKKRGKFKQLGFLHNGWKYISVNPDAHLITLLQWLDSLQRESN
jgi:hypothetical protein